ncbi:hypothetical protein MtrunA17_Chr3g0116831 [Medicago truncatula]|uniref:Uncharacterized protein n=1 Tax=Medicago truncatula TaxID=3880 RepID=A0A396ITI3_MEDTR|nr:hypothetical protein MtrunA17_Chr3g0116831 [Medicago truncatula]
MSSTFFLLQNIHNTFKLRVRSNSSRLSQNHPSLNINLLNTSQQQTHIITSHSIVQNLLKHFHSRHCSAPRFPQTNKVNYITNLNKPPFNSSGGNCSTTSD